MAPSASTKRGSDSGVSTPTKRGSDSGVSTPTKRVGSTSDTSSPKRRATSGDVEGVSPYESPLARVKRAVARDANKRVIDTVGDLKAFVVEEDPMNRGVPASVAASIVLRMRVVWTSFETCSTGPVARLHLVDMCVDDSVDEMREVFKDDYVKNKSIVDAELVTASLYGVDEGTAGMPEDGVTVFVSRMWSLRLFANHSCQLSTSVDSIRIEA